MTSTPVRQQHRGLVLPYEGRPRSATAGPQILLRGEGFGWPGRFSASCARMKDSKSALVWNRTPRRDSGYGYVDEEIATP